MNSVTEAEASFVSNANELQSARDLYDHKGGNAAFDRMMKAAKVIRLESADCGLGFFCSLLASNNPHVVCNAAFLLIPMAPDLARSALEKLAAAGTGEASFNAMITLKEWEFARLQLDWHVNSN